METSTLSSRVSLAAKVLVGLFSPTSAAQVQGMLGGVLPGSSGEPPYRGTTNILKAYSTMPWLRAVSQRVATAVASSATQWMLYAPTSRNARGLDVIQRAGDSKTRQKLLRQAAPDLRPVDDHVLLNALNRANSYMVGQSLFKLTQIHLDLIGESFWIKERNNFGAPVEFWPIPPDWIESTPTPSSRSFKVSFRGWQGTIPDTEILWMCDLDPANPYGRGSGMARALSDELETDEYAAKHTRQLFFNRARPDLIISPKSSGPHDVGLQADQVRRLEERWLDGHQGFWKSFKPFFVGREISVHEVNQSLQELQLVELRKHERDTIVQVFGVPPELLGILTNSNRSTIESADYLFSRWVIAPRMEFLRSQLQERLIPEYDDRLILDFVSPVQEDRDRVLESAKAAPWAMTVNEWRNLQGQDALSGADGNVHMMPLNLVPVPTPSVPPVSPNVVPAGGQPLEQPAPVSVEGIETDNLQDDLEVFKDAQDSEAIEFIVRELTEDFDELPPQWQAVARTIEPAAVRMTVKLFDELRDRLPDDQIAQAQSLPDFERLVQYETWVDEFNENWFEPHLKAFHIGAETTAREVGITIERAVGGVIKQDEGPTVIPPISGAPLSVTFNATNALALEWIRETARDKVREISETTQAGIRASIERALVEGLDVNREARRLLKMKIGLTANQERMVTNYNLDQKKKFPRMSEANRLKKVERYRQKKLRIRAKTIARTEMAYAMTGGREALERQAIKNGLLDPSNLERRWVGVADKKQCNLCNELDGQIIDYGKSFTALAFGQTFASEPAHPNCRCVTSTRTKRQRS